MVRLVNLGHTPYVDELNHLVAASALAGEGTGVFDAGYEYTRARPFTWLVAGSFMLFGESLAAARVPAVIAGTLLVVALFLWVRTAFGRWEGWTAGVLLLVAPQTIYHSQLARFYAFQALFVVGAAWCAWRLASAQSWRSGRTAMLAAGAIACAAGAMIVQISSLVGLAAVGAWLAGALVVRARQQELSLRRIVVPAAVLGAVFVAAALWLHLSGTLARGWAAFNRPGLWAADHADSLRYYHSHFLAHYPLLWAPFPLVALLALRRRAGLASLWFGVFALVFVVQTLAAWKADRYIFYVIPFFFALTAVVLGPVLRGVYRELVAGTRSVMSRTPWGEVHGPGAGSVRATEAGSVRASEAGSGAGPRLLAAAVLAVGLLFAAWGNAAFSYSARMLIETDASWPFPVMYRGEADWGAAGEALEARLDAAEIVVSTTELKAGYFLGRQDLILSNNYLGVASDGTPNPQYHPNHKTGIPVISLPGALEEVIACHRTGLVLVEDNHWRQSWSVDDEVAATLEGHTERVALDPGWRLHAFEWDHGPGFAPDTGECRAVRSGLERVSPAGGPLTTVPAPSTRGTLRSASGPGRRRRPPGRGAAPAGPQRSSSLTRPSSRRSA